MSRLSTMDSVGAVTRAGSVPPTVPDAAAGSWAALHFALEDLRDNGRATLCQRRPEAWSSDASADVRAEAALACEFCAVLRLCSKYATDANERSGVWAGTDRTARPAKRPEETSR